MTFDVSEDKTDGFVSSRDTHLVVVAVVLEDFDAGELFAESIYNLDT